MSFVNIPERTTTDANSFADINQLQENIRVLGGNGTDAPTNDIETLSGTVASFIADNKASSAEAIEGTDDTKIITPLKLRNGLNASGSAPVYACRAWVNFNGTGSVAKRASGNVQSITDNAAGDWTVNFTTAMPDANYSIVLGGSDNKDNTSASASIFDSAQGGTNPTTTNCRICTGAAYDSAYICVAVFR